MDTTRQDGDWQPDQYLKFERERTRPAIDLANRIELTDPLRVLDLGCGPGNSTAVLARRWPDADILGIDNSPAMIEAARSTPLRAEWLVQDIAGDLRQLGMFDVVFSNAVLQWYRDIEELLPRLYALANPGGVLAVQTPYNGDLPAFALIKQLADRPEWRGFFSDPALFRSHPSIRRYYDILCAMDGVTELWQTEYVHIMENHDAIVEWYKGTGLRPFLARLPDDDARQGFLEEYARAVRAAFPCEKNGRVLFPFPRVFFLIAKQRNTE